MGKQWRMIVVFVIVVELLMLSPAKSAALLSVENLHIARAGHSAIVLQNANVFVVGGVDGASPTELLDVMTGVWALKGSLTSSIRNPGPAVLLPNGSVLVTGGTHDELSTYNNADIYDPVTGDWAPTGFMSFARAGHTATVLPNGKVLVVGGIQNLTSLATAELYDPATGLWSMTGSMSDRRHTHTTTLLPNGKVLVTGGYDIGGKGYLASAELYDPSTGMWSTTGSMAFVRLNHTAVFLSNGKVLVIGGVGGAVGTNNNDILNSTELYNPATGLWSGTGNLVTARQRHTSVNLANNTVLVVGGDDNTNLSSAEIYSPTTGIWSITGNLHTPRSGHTLTRLAGGLAMVIGGYNSQEGTLKSVELYNPAQQIWTAAPVPRVFVPLMEK